MPVELQSLIARIRVDDSEFQRGLDDAQSRLERFGREVGGVSEALSRTLRGVFSGFSEEAKTATAEVKRALSGLDLNVSAQAGIDTQNLREGRVATERLISEVRRAVASPIEVVANIEDEGLQLGVQAITRQLRNLRASAQRDRIIAVADLEATMFEQGADQVDRTIEALRRETGRPIAALTRIESRDLIQDARDVRLRIDELRQAVLAPIEAEAVLRDAGLRRGARTIEARLQDLRSILGIELTAEASLSIAPLQRGVGEAQGQLAILRDLVDQDAVARAFLDSTDLREGVGEARGFLFDLRALTRQDFITRTSLDSVGVRRGVDDVRAHLAGLRPVIEQDFTGVVSLDGRAVGRGVTDVRGDLRTLRTALNEEYLARVLLDPSALETGSQTVEAILRRLSGVITQNREAEVGFDAVEFEAGVQRVREGLRNLSTITQRTEAVASARLDTEEIQQGVRQVETLLTRLEGVSGREFESRVGLDFAELSEGLSRVTAIVRRLEPIAEQTYVSTTDLETAPLIEGVAMVQDQLRRLRPIATQEFVAEAGLDVGNLGRDVEGVRVALRNLEASVAAPIQASVGFDATALRRVSREVSGQLQALRGVAGSPIMATADLDTSQFEAGRQTIESTLSALRQRLEQQLIAFARLDGSGVDTGVGEVSDQLRRLQALTDEEFFARVGLNDEDLRRGLVAVEGEMTRLDQLTDQTFLPTVGLDSTGLEQGAQEVSRELALLRPTAEQSFLALADLESVGLEQGTREIELTLNRLRSLMGQQFLASARFDGAEVNQGVRVVESALDTLRGEASQEVLATARLDTSSLDQGIIDARAGVRLLTTIFGQDFVARAGLETGQVSVGVRQVQSDLARLSGLVSQEFQSHVDLESEGLRQGVQQAGVQLAELHEAASRPHVARVDAEIAPLRQNVREAERLIGTLSSDLSDPVIARADLVLTGLRQGVRAAMGEVGRLDSNLSQPIRAQIGLDDSDLQRGVEDVQTSLRTLRSSALRRLTVEADLEEGALLAGLESIPQLIQRFESSAGSQVRATANLDLSLWGRQLDSVTGDLQRLRAMTRTEAAVRVELDDEPIRDRLRQLRPALSELERTIIARTDLDRDPLDRGLVDAQRRLTEFERGLAVATARVRLDDTAFQDGVQESLLRLASLRRTMGDPVAVQALLDTDPMNQGTVELNQKLRTLRRDVSTPAIVRVGLDRLPLVQGSREVSNQIRDLRAITASGVEAIVRLEDDPLTLGIREASQRLDRFRALAAAPIEARADLDRGPLEFGIRTAQGQMAGLRRTMETQLVARADLNTEGLRAGTVISEGELARLEATFAAPITAIARLDASQMAGGANRTEQIADRLRGSLRSPIVARAEFSTTGVEAGAQVVQSTVGRLARLVREPFELSAVLRADELDQQVRVAQGQLARLEGQVYEAELTTTDTALRQGLSRAQRNLDEFAAQTATVDLGIDQGTLQQSLREPMSMLDRLSARARSTADSLQGVFRGVSAGIDLSPAMEGLRVLVARAGDAVNQVQARFTGLRPNLSLDTIVRAFGELPTAARRSVATLSTTLSRIPAEAVRVGNQISAALTNIRTSLDTGPILSGMSMLRQESAGLNRAMRGSFSFRPPEPNFEAFLNAFNNLRQRVSAAAQAVRESFSQVPIQVDIEPVLDTFKNLPIRARAVAGVIRQVFSNTAVEIQTDGVMGAFTRVTNASQRVAQTISRVLAGIAPNVNFRGFLNRLRNLVPFGKRAGDEVGEGIAAGVRRGSQNASRSLQQLGEDSQRHASLISGNIARAIQQGGLTFVGETLRRNITIPLVNFGRSALDAVVKIDSLQRGLTAIMGSAEAAGKEFEELRAVARLPGVGFEGAIKASQGLQAVGLSAEQARATIIAFANGVSRSGGGVNEFNSVLLQLQQSLSSGKFQGDEFRIMAENVADLRKVMKEQLGVGTTEELKKLGLSAKQATGFLIEGLLELEAVAPGPREAIESLRVTWTVAMAKMKDSMMPFISQLTGSLEPAIERIAEAFTKLPASIQQTVVALGGFLASIGPILAIVGGLTFAITQIGLPLAGLIAAFVALGAAIIGNVGGIRDTLMGVLVPAWEGVVAGFQRGIQWFRTNIHDWREFTVRETSQVMETLRMLGPIADWLVDQFKVFTGWFARNFPLIQRTTKRVLQSVNDNLRTLTKIFMFAFRTITPVLEAALKAILGVVKVILHLINGEWESAADEVLRIVARMIKGVIKAIASATSDIIGGIVDWLTGIGDKEDDAQNEGEKIGEAVGEGVIQGVKAKGSAVLKSIVDLITFKRVGSAAVRAVDPFFNELFGTPENVQKAIEEARKAGFSKESVELINRAQALAKDVSDAYNRGLIDSTEGINTIADLMTAMAKKNTETLAAEAKRAGKVQVEATKSSLEEQNKMRQKSLTAALQLQNELGEATAEGARKMAEEFQKEFDKLTKELALLRAPDLEARLRIEFPKFTEDQIRVLAALTRERDAEKEAVEATKQAIQEANRSLETLRESILKNLGSLRDPALEQQIRKRLDAFQTTPTPGQQATASVRDVSGLLREMGSQFGLRVSSAGRTAERNRQVGGSPTSAHLITPGFPQGRALDFAGTQQQMANFTRALVNMKELEGKLGEVFFTPVTLQKMGAELKKTADGYDELAADHMDHVHVSILASEMNTKVARTLMDAANATGVLRAEVDEATRQEIARRTAMDAMLKELVSVNQELGLVTATTEEGRIAIKHLADEFVAADPKIKRVQQTLADRKAMLDSAKLIQDIEQGLSEARLAYQAALAPTEAHRVALTKYKSVLELLDPGLQSLIRQTARFNQLTTAGGAVRDLEVELRQLAATTDVERKSLELLQNSFEDNIPVVRSWISWIVRAERATAGFERLKGARDALKGVQLEIAKLANPSQAAAIDVLGSPIGEFIEKIREMGSEFTIVAEQSDSFIDRMRRAASQGFEGNNGLINLVKQFDESLEAIGPTVGRNTPAFRELKDAVEALRVALEILGATKTKENLEAMGQAAEDNAQQILDFRDALRDTNIDFEISRREIELDIVALRQFGTSFEQVFEDAAIAGRGVGEFGDTVQAAVRDMESFRLVGTTFTQLMQQLGAAALFGNIGELQKLTAAKAAIEGATKSYMDLMRLGAQAAPLDIEGGLLKDLEALDFELKQITRDTEMFEDVLGELNLRAENTTPTIQMLSEELGNKRARNALMEMRQEARRTFDIMAGKIPPVAALLDQLGIKYENLERHQQEFAEQVSEEAFSLKAVTEFVNGMGQVFEQGLLDIREKGFGSFFTSVMQGFDQLLQQMAARFLASKLIQILSQSLSGLFGNTGFKEVTSEVGKTTAFLAGGGPLAAGQAAVVGERGPEVFIPRMSGQVLNQEQFSKALAGVKASSNQTPAIYNTTIHVHGVTNPSEWRRTEGQMAARLSNRIEEQRRRNGG